MESSHWVIGLVSAVIGSIGTGIAWLLSRSDGKESKHISRLEARIDKLEEHHAACVRENAELREEVGTLRAEAAQANELRDEVNSLRIELDQVKRELKTERDRPR